DHPKLAGRIAMGVPALAGPRAVVLQVATGTTPIHPTGNKQASVSGFEQLSRRERPTHATRIARWDVGALAGTKATSAGSDRRHQTKFLAILDFESLAAFTAAASPAMASIRSECCT